MSEQWTRRYYLSPVTIKPVSASDAKRPCRQPPLGRERMSPSKDLQHLERRRLDGVALPEVIIARSGEFKNASPVASTTASNRADVDSCTAGRKRHGVVTAAVRSCCGEGMPGETCCRLPCASGYANSRISRNDESGRRSARSRQYRPIARLSLQ